MSGKMGVVVVAILGMIFATPSFANFVFPGTVEDLSANTSLSEITGTLDLFNNPNDVDVFEISIQNPLGFAAYTVGGAFGIPDPELFLFNSDGFGVYMNDDVTASDTQSCLPSVFLDPCTAKRGFFGPINSGIYYLAITSSANSPLSDTGYIFSPWSTTDVAGPDLFGGGGWNPITGWDNGAYTSPDYDLSHYDIVLQGIAPVPEPSVVSGLIALAGLALLIGVRARRHA